MTMECGFTNLISDALYYYFPLPKQDYVFEMAASTYVIVRSFRKNNYCLKLVVNKPTKPSLFSLLIFFLFLINFVWYIRKRKLLKKKLRNIVINY